MTEKPYVRGWLAAACALLLAACGNGSDSAGQADAGPTTPAALSFRVAGNAPAGTPWHAQWERFEASIREQPESGLDPQMFVTGQLGNPDAALANTRRGRVQVGGFPLAGAATVVPELNMLLVPFLFENEAEVDYVLDNHLLSAFEDLFREKQLVLLQWVDAGWNNLYGSESLATPTAVSGKALRSQPTIASQVFLESLGADTIPMGYAEVLPALQTGLIKGGESVTPMYLVGGLVGEASHLTLTRHAYDSGVIVANRTWFEG
ncbi:MAG: TRAP transporter substrate-binding protein DctP, partial [Pseudomonadota bacterium]